MEKKKWPLPLKILIGLTLGVITGIILQPNPELADVYVKPIGTIFLNLIKLIIVPLVFSSILVSVKELEDATKLGKIGLKTLLYFFITTALAVTIGLIFANIFKVGQGFSIPSGNLDFKSVEPVSLIDTLVGIIPSNPIKAIVEGEMLQIIVFALILGTGLLYVGKESKVVFDFFDAITKAMYKITNYIMSLAPIGVFGLIAPVIANNGPGVLLPLSRAILVVYLASIFHIFIVYGTAVKFIGKIGFKDFFKGVLAPATMAFTSASSSGTLPISMETAQDNFGVSKPIASFVLPLGATINMDGTAIYQGVCALFISQVYGINLGIPQQITIILTAILASIGTAGVPGAGTIMLAMVLQGVGLPLEGIALIAGVDRIFDMARTTVNIIGDISCSIVIGKTENEIKDTPLSKNKIN
ncbi:MAG: dicarboxylate/amino acid:cation symporter [Peptoniphilaceae bacterium]